MSANVLTTGGLARPDPTRVAGLISREGATCGPGYCVHTRSMARRVGCHIAILFCDIVCRYSDEYTTGEPWSGERHDEVERSRGRAARGRRLGGSVPAHLPAP